MGTEHQHRDQHDKGEHILIVAAKHAVGGGPQIAGAQGFDQPQQQAAEHGPLEVADTAQHRCGKRLDAGQKAHIEMRAAVVAGHHDARQRGQGAADGEGHDNDAVGVDAHQARHLRVLGHGAHGPAKARALDQQQQPDHQAQRHANGGQRGGIGHGGMGGIAGQYFDGFQRQQLREHLRIAGPDQHGDGLQQQRHADTTDQRRQARGVAQAPIGDTLDHHRQHRTKGHGNHRRCQQQQHRRHLREGRLQHTDHRQAHQRANHQHIAMGKVDDPQNAVDHGVTQGH